MIVLLIVVQVSIHQSLRCLKMLPMETTH